MSDDRQLIDERGLSTADLVAPTAEPARHEPQSQQPRPSRDEARQAEAQKAEPVDVPQQVEDQAPEPLFAKDQAEQLRQRWTAIQAGFVDQPRRSVEEADSLVAAAIKHVAETFADERSRLESQWDKGDDVSTEDLRVALRRYRSFFDRILSM